MTSAGSPAYITMFPQTKRAASKSVHQRCRSQLKRPTIDVRRPAKDTHPTPPQKLLMAYQPLGVPKT